MRRSFAIRSLAITLVTTTGSVGCHFAHQDRNASPQVPVATQYAYQTHAAITQAARVPTLGTLTEQSAASIPHQPPPAYHQPTPGIDRSVVPVVNRSVTDEDLLDAWDLFDDPRLRWIQSIGLRNAVDSSEIQSRLRQSGVVANTSHLDTVSQRHELMYHIARSLTVVRHQQSLLGSTDRLLASQKDAFEEARVRSQVGSVTNAELVALVAQAQSIERTRPLFQQQIGREIGRLEILIGQALTESLIAAIGDQPQLELPGIDDRIDASRLRYRCDVDKATQRVRQMTAQSGLNETEIYPLLSLQGNIYAERSESAQRFGDSMSFQSDALGESHWTPPTSGTAGSLRGRLSSSPLQQAMSGYHGVVTDAASQVKQLLTRYVNTRNIVRGLRTQVDDAIENLRVKRSRFDVDRATVDEMISAQVTLLERQTQLHRSEADLALNAVDLFVALGGPCHLDRVMQADYYEPQP